MFKYRLVIVNIKGYSLMCTVVCSEDEIDTVKAVVGSSEDIAVVRTDLLGPA